MGLVLHNKMHGVGDFNLDFYLTDTTDQLDDCKWWVVFKAKHIPTGNYRQHQFHSFDNDFNDGMVELSGKIESDLIQSDFTKEEVSLILDIIRESLREFNLNNY